jgi:hypothetical protein
MMASPRHGMPVASSIRHSSSGEPEPVANSLDRVRSLTKPTRGRIVLWLFLALLWFLFLPQQLAMDPAIKHV